MTSLVRPARTGLVHARAPQHGHSSTIAPILTWIMMVADKRTKKKEGDKTKAKKKGAEVKKKPAKAAAPAAAAPRAGLQQSVGARGLPPNMGGISRGAAPLSASMPARPGGLKDPMSMDFGDDDELSMSDLGDDLEMEGDDDEGLTDAPPLRDPARVGGASGSVAGGGGSLQPARQLMGGPGTGSLAATMPARAGGAPKLAPKPALKPEGRATATLEDSFERELAMELDADDAANTAEYSMEGFEETSQRSPDRAPAAEPTPAPAPAMPARAPGLPSRAPMLSAVASNPPAAHAPSVAPTAAAGGGVPSRAPGLPLNSLPSPAAFVPSASLPRNTQPPPPAPGLPARSPPASTETAPATATRRSSRGEHNIPVLSEVMPQLPALQHPFAM